MKHLCLILLIASVSPAAIVSAQENNPKRDILVTFDNQGARATGAGMGAPYRNRKRYAIAVAARRNAEDIKEQYSLVEVDHWPIRSLSIYCFVYRVPAELERDDVIEQLSSDTRVESVQALQEFETGTSAAIQYDDTYAHLQHGLSLLDIGAAHRISQGKGVRIAIIDSDADSRHEDLRGRIRKIEVFTSNHGNGDAEHGTAIASVIGASANNAAGIVGIAPRARLELYVSCWADAESGNTICDSFTLAKALDTLLEEPPDILNMSLTGPHDPLLARLLAVAFDAGVITVAARAEDDELDHQFPAALPSVIGVGSSEQLSLPSSVPLDSEREIYAPGSQIMVAVPNNSYDFRSGSSLAAAHVTGTIALLLAVSPDLSHESVLAYLRQSQQAPDAVALSVNACIVLQLDNQARTCR